MPPSEANFAARRLARRYARAGVHAAVVIRHEDVFLDPTLDAPGIEAKLRATVVAALAVVAVLAERPEVDGERISYLGISAGGIFGAVLLAVESRIALGKRLSGCLQA